MNTLYPISSIKLFLFLSDPLPLVRHGIVGDNIQVVVICDIYYQMDILCACMHYLFVTKWHCTVEGMPINRNIVISIKQTYVQIYIVDCWLTLTPVR